VGLRDTWKSANNIAALVNEKQTPHYAAFFYLTIILSQGEKIS
jgi:hypothetical protein